MQSLKLRLFSYLAGAWEFRWYGLAMAFAACLSGWFAVALIPNIFESEAKVYIDTDTLLRPLLRGLAVTTDADQEVNVMLRTLLSDTNVEQVIRATDPNVSNVSGIAMRDKIASIQQRVQLRDLGTANLYSISFRDSNPRYAQAVTQALLSVLVDSNLGSQRQDSDSVRSFLDNQIQDYEQKLVEADKRRADFKAAHLNLFSTGADGAVEVGGGVVPATAAVTQAQTELDEAVARRNSLRSALGSMQQTLDVNAPPAVIMGGTSADAGNPYTELALARERLAELRTRFTDAYPDVIAQKTMISRLEAEISSGSPDGGVGKQGISNPTYVALRSKLADEEANVAVAQERLAGAQQRLQMAKEGAVNALSVQRQYEDLDRDYQVLHENYQQLVQRRESANISQAAGSQQSAVFRVIDPPLKPDRPIAPNRLFYNVLVLIGGLAVGFGTAIGLSLFQGRFFSTEALSEAFDFPSIGSVTTVDSSFELAQQWRATLLFAAGVGLLMLSYLIILILFHTPLAVPQGNIL